MLSNGEINGALINITKRAESNSTKNISETFVEAGHFMTVLTTRENQIIFGRYGTGKTHAMKALAQQAIEKGDISVYIDLRTIGSSNGLHDGETQNIFKRATSLLQDILGNILNGLQSHIFHIGGHENLHNLINRFSDAILNVRIDGEITTEEQYVDISKVRDVLEGNMKLSVKPEVQMKLILEQIMESQKSSKTIRTGIQRHSVHFGEVHHVLSEIIDELDGKRLWVLVDEWVEIPKDIQPLLADFIGRALFPLNNIYTKIAAVEYDSVFNVVDASGNKIGFKVGVHATPSLELDEFLIFNNKHDDSNVFFESLFLKHVNLVLKENEKSEFPDVNSLIGSTFTQDKAFSEIVRACEGNPRDFINILSQAALKANDQKIGIPHIRSAADYWYNRSKLNELTEEGKNLLQWIIDEVIKGKKARAFLLDVNRKEKLIDEMYNQRILHILKNNTSGQDIPGKRFIVYQIDYGCYVNLMQTTYSPNGLFEVQEVGASNESFVDVPSDDYRSIRRAILDLDEYHGHAAWIR
jgi:hypothetical protein